MDTLTGCEIGDVFCAARPGRGLNWRPVLTPCFICGRGTCLSCAVRLEVRMPLTGRTLGTHVVCHACAQRVQDGPEAVRRHFALMGGRGVPSQAPEAPSRVVLSTPPKPKPKSKKKPRVGKAPSMAGAEPAPVAREYRSTSSSYREHPVTPEECSPTLLKELGHAR